jgi:hypothetical protein
MPASTILFTLFPIVPKSFELWHHRSGRLGQEATQNMLIKDHATSIVYKPTAQTSSRCIPCLINKAPQAPFTHNAKEAFKVCELIYIITCGLFSTLTPRKKSILYCIS